MTRSVTIDWARIEIEYLAGEDSIREIADRHEISDTAIRKRAKAQGWKRPVRSANRREPTRILPKPIARAAAATSDAPTDSIEASRKLIARMLDELDAVTTGYGELEEMIFDATAEDDGNKRLDAMLRATSLPSRAATVKTLALALKTLNEAGAPQGKKAVQRDQASAVGSAPRFSRLGPPTSKTVN